MFQFILLTLGVLYIFPETVPHRINANSQVENISLSLKPVKDAALPKTNQRRYHRETDNCNLKENYFLVSLRRLKDYFHVCMGSLISGRWILTAAYCFTTSVVPDVAMLGIHTIDKNSDRIDKVNDTIEIIRGIEKYFLHDKFDRETMIHDIAMILLTKEANTMEIASFTKIVYYDDLEDDLTEQCEKPTVLIWAGLNPNTNPSPHRECISDPYAKNKDCPKRYKHLDNTIMCTNGPSSGRNSCLESIGAPLFCGDYQFGVVSWADGCDHPRAPRYYTRIDKHKVFIQNTLSANDINAENENSQLSPYLLISILTSVLIQILNFIKNSL